VNAWRYCTEVFDLFTVAAIIDNQTLCIHGGLSPDINTLDQIRALKRNQEIPHKGALCDLVWSDPDEVGKFLLVNYIVIIHNSRNLGNVAAWSRMAFWKICYRRFYGN